MERATKLVALGRQKIIQILASYDEVYYSKHKFLDTGAASGDYLSSCRAASEQDLNFLPCTYARVLRGGGLMGSIDPSSSS